MKESPIASIVARSLFACSLLLAPALAIAAEPLLVTSEAIAHAGAPIPKKFAACIPTSEGKSTKGENLRPTISWEGGGEEEVKSYAIVVSDPDVPADLSIADQEELLIAEDMPRQTFYHWVQFNITPATRSVPGGDKPPGFGRSAANDVNAGSYKLGYGGPCPPWNDAMVHHYHFTVHGLSTARLPLSEGVSAKEAVGLIEKYSITRGEMVGIFTNNPKLRKGEKL